MNFKRLELNGFKSFADPVTIEFSEGMTCIVGPNGSGKSNISDAIRWVLGEQSPKMLRGGKMEEVIFAGTQNRKPKGMAEVTLVIDNADHTLPIEYAEVAITRRMYRSGESEYLINHNICRLKDIRELIMDTGIGVEGYSIIGQGKIADIIDNKMDSRREIFEEAAGITKYRTKKLEAERKLERANDNLTRVNDIVHEIEGRIGSLENESRKATEYLEIRDKYKDVEINIILKNIETADSKTASVREELAQLEEAITKDEQDKTILENTIRAGREKLNQLEEKLNLQREALMAKTEEIHEISGRGEVNKEKLEGLKRDQERLTAEIAAIGEKLVKENENQNLAKGVLESAAEEEAALDLEFRQKHQLVLDAQVKLEQASEKFESQKNELFTISSDISSARATADSLESLKQTLLRRSERLEEDESLEDLKQKLEERHKKAVEDKERAASGLSVASNNAETARVSLSMLQARYNLLDELEKSYEGYGGGVKFLMGQGISGVIGTLGDLLEVPRGLELAIETVLGGKLQDIVCTGDDVAKKSINILKSNKAGRLTFLPVDSLRVNKPLDTSRIQGEKGFMGLASEKVSLKGGYRNVVEYMLGNVVIVDNIDNAIAISKKNAAPYKLVTVEGEVINAAGAITGGSFKNNTANILTRKAEKQDIARSLKQAEIDLANAEKQRAEAQELINSAEEERIKTENEIRSAEIRLDELSDLTREIENAEKDMAPALEKLSQLEESKRSTEAVLETLADYAEKCSREYDKAKDEETKAKMAQNAAELKTSNARDFADLAASAIAELTSDKENKEKQLESAKLLQQQILDFEGSAAQLLADKEAEKAEIEKQLEELNEGRQSISADADKFENERAELEKLAYEHQTKKHDADVRMARFDAQTETLKEKLFDEFEMSYAEALEHADPEFVLSRAMKESKEYKDRLRALGDVNIGAIEEYKTVKERYDFLTAQRDDINQAMSELTRVINEMDTIIKSRFHESFDLVAENFEKTFSELFKGGHARLSMEDPANPLETTIEIEAQPPGKKLQNMNLLSGGEKTVTAIALMFAVLKAKPTPFCILDEIEAALDDANIDGVARYIRNFPDSQFALVTHQKLTMEYADALYGVTMPEHGVSQVLSLKLGDDFEVD